MPGGYVYSADCQTGLRFGNMCDPEYYPSSPAVLKSILKGKLRHQNSKKHDSGHEHARKGSTATNASKPELRAKAKRSKRKTKSQTNTRTAKAMPHAPNAAQTSSVATIPAHRYTARIPKSIPSNAQICQFANVLKASKPEVCAKAKRPRTKTRTFKAQTNARTAKAMPHAPDAAQASSVATFPVHESTARIPESIPSNAQSCDRSSVQRSSIRKCLKALRIPVEPIDAKPTPIFPLHNGTTVSYLVRLCTCLLRKLK